VGGSPLNFVDSLGLDVCTLKSSAGYRHEWIEINGDVSRTYGQWPGDSLLFSPALIFNPDPRARERTKPETERSCQKSTPDEDNELEKWIRSNFKINPPRPGESNPNRNYNPVFNNCVTFTHKVREQLKVIQQQKQQPRPHR
jgi:hypothetical protein